MSTRKPQPRPQVMIISQKGEPGWKTCETGQLLRQQTERCTKFWFEFSLVEFNSICQPDCTDGGNLTLVDSCFPPTLMSPELPSSFKGWTQHEGGGNTGPGARVSSSVLLQDLLLQASPCLLANQFMQILPEPCVIIVLTPDISRPAGSQCHVLTNLSFPQNILLFPAPYWGSWKCTVRPLQPPWLRCLIEPLLICMFVSLSTDESQNSLKLDIPTYPHPTPRTQLRRNR